MTPADVKKARHILGLSLSQMALMQDTDARSVRRYEADPDRSTHANAPPRYVRLLAAYLDGYRPADWPKEE